MTSAGTGLLAGSWRNWWRLRQLSAVMLPVPVGQLDWGPKDRIDGSGRAVARDRESRVPPSLRDDRWVKECLAPGYCPAEVTLQLLVGRSHMPIQNLRLGLQQWLGRWEAQSPPGFDDEVPTLSQYAAEADADLLSGRAYHFAALVDGQLAGQFALTEVVRGATRTAAVGYWLVPWLTGIGIAPAGLRVLLEFAFVDLGLHRVEASIDCENTDSIRVVRKLGFRFEGVRKGYFFARSEWQDHAVYALTEPDFGTSQQGAW